MKIENWYWGHRMDKSTEKAVLKELSSELDWDEQSLEIFQDKVEWKAISNNTNILWTASMIEKFKNKVDWDELSGSNNEHLFTVENLEQFKNYWNWRELSRNPKVELTPALLEQFAEYWDWNEIINCCSLEFLEKYQDYIPTSALQCSGLWKKLVEAKKKQ